MMYNSTTTLENIRAASPCQDGWIKLLKTLGKAKSDREPIDLIAVLDSNGLDDALWVLSYGMGDEFDGRIARHFQAWCAEQVLYVFKDENTSDARLRTRINVLKSDTATEHEKSASLSSVNRAFFDARSWLSRNIVESIADESVYYSARKTAHVTAWGPSECASRAAAKIDDWSEGWARQWCPVWSETWDAAWDTARDAQEKQLRKMLAGKGD